MPDITALGSFPIILLISSIGSVAGSLLTGPDDEKVLMKFYSSVRPWGFWRPIYEKVKNENPMFEKNIDFKRDMTNCVVGTAWQMSMVVMPIYLVIHEFGSMTIALGVFLTTSVLLKVNWWNRLEN